MKKRILTGITLIALLSLFTQFIYAEETSSITDNINNDVLENLNDDIGIMASQYISSYEVLLSPSSNGKILIYLDVVGTGIMDKIGFSNLYLQEYNNGSWQTVLTLNDYKYSAYRYLNEIGVYCNVGKTYRAIVYFYSEKDGGSDTRSQISNSVVAQ